MAQLTDGTGKMKGQTSLPKQAGNKRFLIASGCDDRSVLIR